MFVSRKRNRIVLKSRLPLSLLVAWLILETCSVFVPDWVSDEVYSQVYLYSNDWATVALAWALYISITYRSTVLKMAAFCALSVSVAIAIINIAVDLTGVTDSTFGLSMGSTLLFLVTGALRFSFRQLPTDNEVPKLGQIYAIVDKPHSHLSLLGVALAGKGAIVPYCDGTIWRYKKESGKMVKESDPTYHIGRQKLCCGPATHERIKELDARNNIGWSFMNNCQTIWRGLEWLT